MNPNRALPLLLLIFTVSGFSGLIYESIWSHYLKLFLGHAAYSQVLVLAIFMGGLAMGSALAGRYSVRWRQVLLGYAAVEAITGIIALLFHGAFDAITRVSFSTIIPALDAEASVHAYKWGLGAAMILPQSILLGMTFPLMSAGFLRYAPARAGQSVALLYFTNSFGGAVGVLASGFVLIPGIGLPGAIMTAGVLNIAVALATFLLVRTVPEQPARAPEAMEAPHGAAAAPGYRMLLAASLVTGMASFCYEIGWLRMLSLVLGASTHAFELMLSAFILGLALGGLWIRRRIEGTTDALRLLAIVQVAMGLLALSTLYVYGHTFEWMSVVMNTFARNDFGYAGFNVASHLIASAVMIPTTFCAGMTLPLITWLALRSGQGERALGAVYAANTVGAILGIALAVHVFMPLLNAKGVIIVGALMDFGLGIALLNASPAAVRQRRLAIAALAGLAAFSWAGIAGDVDARTLVSGVYRHGLSQAAAETVAYVRDGKTATVSLTRDGSVIRLATNGKVDASMNRGSGPRTRDESTQALAGAIPVLVHPAAKTAAVIGLGSGMSTHMLLAAPGLERVDTIEIERRIIEAARLGFMPRNARAYEDPRSVLHVEDAKTFFSVSRSRFDIIVSEPSNPWVSGVSSLFTQEFYRHAAGYLNEGGVLVQWVQLYEIDFDAVASIAKALSPWFSDYVAFSANDIDMLIVARKGGLVGDLDESVYRQPAMRNDLRLAGIADIGEIRARRIAGKELLDPYFGASGAPVNSDYFPYIDQQAARARFKLSDATEVTRLLAVSLPIPEMLSAGRRESRAWEPLSGDSGLARAHAQRMIAAVMAPPGANLTGLDIALVHSGASNCGAHGNRQWEAAWQQVARRTVRYLDAGTAAGFWEGLVPRRCHARLSREARDWLALLQALSVRDAQAALPPARVLLQRTGSSMPVADTVYLVSVIMLGELALDKPRKALQARAELVRSLPAGYALPDDTRWLEAIARRAVGRT